MGRQVPWASWAEWAQVRLWLFSHQEPDVRCGIDRVAAWRSRGKLPLAVDATAALLEASLMDTPACEQLSGSCSTSTTGRATSRSSSSEYSLRLQYALPLIRLVNGITDVQQRGRVASSVALLASAAGLPRSLVDLRHEATHNELPSLHVLRLGCRQALDWLLTSYWQGQAQHVDTCYSQLAQVLQQLHASLSAAAEKGNTSSLADDLDDVEEDTILDSGSRAGSKSGYSSAEGQRQRKELLSQLKSLVPSAWVQALVPVLLDFGVMEPPAVVLGGAGGSVAGTKGGAVLLSSQQPGSSVKRGDGGGAFGSFGSAGAAQASSSRATNFKAWRSGMHQLFKVYPQLRTLMLQGALQRMQRLAAQHQGPAASEAGAGVESTTASLLSWVEHLLPAVRKELPSKGSGSAKKGNRQQQQQQAAAEGDDGEASKLAGAPPSLLDQSLTVEQVQQLLGMATAGLHQSSSATGSGTSATGLGPALRHVVSRLVALLEDVTRSADPAQQQGSASLLWLATSTLEAHASTCTSSGKSGSGKHHGGANGGAERTAAESGSSDLEQQLQELQRVEVGQRQLLAGVSCIAAKSTATNGGSGVGAADSQPGSSGAGLAGRKRARQAEGPESGPASGSQEQGSEQMPRRRWKLASSWTPCAIGCLPDALNPSGRPCILAEPLKTSQDGGLHQDTGAGAGQPASESDADLDLVAAAASAADDDTTSLSLEEDVCCEDGWVPNYFSSFSMDSPDELEAEYGLGPGAGQLVKLGAWQVPFADLTQIKASVGYL